MKSDAYIANLKLTISTYFREGDMPDHYKKHLHWEALSSQQRNAMGCQKLQGTSELLIKASKRVYDMSHFNAFIKVNNIKMKEG